MSNMEKYNRTQIMINNLKLNLSDLYNQKRKILNDLLKVEKQIQKHKDFLVKLEGDE